MKTREDSNHIGRDQSKISGRFENDSKIEYEFELKKMYAMGVSDQ